MVGECARLGCLMAADGFEPCPLGVCIERWSFARGIFVPPMWRMPIAYVASGDAGSGLDLSQVVEWDRATGRTWVPAAA